MQIDIIVTQREKGKELVVVGEETEGEGGNEDLPLISRKRKGFLSSSPKLVIISPEPKTHKVVQVSEVQVILQRNMLFSTSL